MCISPNHKEWLLYNHGFADSGRIIPGEENLAFKVGEGCIPSLLELWVSSREYFVLGKHYTKKLEKAGKLESIRRYGIPILQRPSGGEAILHDSSCINLCVIVSRTNYPELRRIDMAFKILSSGLLRSLEGMGIQTRFGTVARFCPGPYDILVEGKKIAGLSVLIRGGFALLHGTLFVESGAEYASKLEVFYGSVRDEITCLRTLTGKSVNIKDLSGCIAEGYREALKISFKCKVSH